MRERVDAQSLNDLQWAHQTLVRMMALVQRHGLLGPRHSECVVQIGKSVVLLEGVIQESLADARRRKTD